MRKTALIASGALLLALAGTALAENGGDREMAGGAFMSSYSKGPYANTSRTAAPAPNPGLNPQEDVVSTASVRPRSRRAR